MSEPRKTRTGRPRKLDARIVREGRTLTVAEAILEDAAHGYPFAMTCHRAGISTIVVLKWMQEAARLSEKQLLNPTIQFTDEQDQVIEFVSAFDAARAEAERGVWQQLDSLATVTKRRKRTVKIDPNQIDPRTGQPLILEHTMVEEDVLPSERVLTWKLANQYARAVPLEVRVEQGALSDEERAQAMMDGLDAFFAVKRAEEQAAIEAESHDTTTNGSSGNGETPGDGH